MRAIRLVGFGLLALAAILCLVLLKPTPAQVSIQTTPSHSSEISTALSDERTNAISASSAPQQAVVEGWATRDLLAVIARQQDDLATRTAELETVVDDGRREVDNRVPALITIAALALCWLGLTSEWGGSEVLEEAALATALADNELDDADEPTPSVQEPPPGGAI